MKEDHANARYLADSLQQLGYRITYPVDINMVYATATESAKSIGLYAEKLAAAGIVVTRTQDATVRLVTHLQVPRPAIDALLAMLREPL